LWCRFPEAIDDCTKAIALDSEYVKAYLRRGLAFTSLEEPEAAIEDLTKAVQMEPANKEARKCLADAKVLLKKVESTDNSTIVAISKPLHERSKVLYLQFINIIISKMYLF
jgi:DnaJ homolog subfamily C member 7